MQSIYGFSERKNQKKKSWYYTWQIKTWFLPCSDKINVKSKFFISPTKIGNDHMTGFFQAGFFGEVMAQHDLAGISEQFREKLSWLFTLIIVIFDMIMIFRR